MSASLILFTYTALLNKDKTNKSNNTNNGSKQWTTNIFNVVTFICTDFLADLKDIPSLLVASFVICYSLGPDQDGQNVGPDSPNVRPDLDPNFLTLW